MTPEPVTFLEENFKPNKVTGLDKLGFHPSVEVLQGEIAKIRVENIKFSESGAYLQ